jgi:hypothetical protein
MTYLTEIHVFAYEEQEYVFVVCYKAERKRNCIISKPKTGGNPAGIHLVKNNLTTNIYFRK